MEKGLSKVLSPKINLHVKITLKATFPVTEGAVSYVESNC